MSEENKELSHEESLEKQDPSSLENIDTWEAEGGTETADQNPEKVEGAEGEESTPELNPEEVPEEIAAVESPGPAEIPVYTFAGDFKKIFSRPLYIFIFALALLLIALFILIALQMREEQELKALEGYVRVNHKLPKGFKGEPSHEIKELLKIYETRRRTLKESLTLIKEDPRLDEPVLGMDHPEPVTNAELIPILQKQKLGKVDLGGAEQTESMNLSGFNLTKLNFKYFFKFVGSDLRYCDFTGITEEGLEFRGASMQYSQFVDATVKKGNFVRTKLSFSNFYNATLDGSLFIGAVAEQAQFDSANLVDCDFTDAVIFDSDFEEVTAYGLVARNVHFEGVSFRGASLVGANFKDANLEGVNFAGADLTDANFQNAKLEGSNFTGANIQGANFAGADVTVVNFQDVQNASYEQLNKSQFLPSAINVPKEIMPKKYNWDARITPPRRT